MFFYRSASVRNALFFFCICVLSTVGNAQAPAIQWEHLYCDGPYNDATFVLMNDGGAVIGTSAKTNIYCEKSEYGEGGYDYWIYRIDSIGNIIWQNVIGGSGDDKLSCINKTSDGGFILAGASNSPISGDKTEPRQDLTYPFSDDMWIIKLDSVGNIQWQNTIGGNYGEWDAYIEQTTSGAYILSCTSNSHLSGDKMEDVIGGTTNDDFWILKLNPSGNIMWQNTIGGTENDWVSAVHQLPDGGYICAGTSASPISGDKTEANLTPGYTDYWIVKLNNGGDVVWDKTLGGLYSDWSADIIREDDGTFTLGGSGGNYFGLNFQVLRLSADGELIWEHILDAPNSDLKSISKTMDGGYILGGSSSTDYWTDKTDPNKPANDYGWEGWDMWVVKTDSMGNHVWDNALGSGDDDGVAFVRETADGGYLVSGYAGHDDEGDISDKASLYDGTWIVKLASAACVPTIELCNGIDDNCDGIADNGVVESIVVSPAGPVTFCKGESVDLNVVSYTGTGVQWKKNGEDIPGATDITYTATKTGLYTCQTSSDCGFAISSIIDVTANKIPNASIDADGPVTFCSGDSVTLIETPFGGCSYQWYIGHTPIPGATSTSFEAFADGNYRCAVTKVATGCTGISNKITVSVPCRETNDPSLQDVLLYPNPTSDLLFVSTSFTAFEYQVTDMPGALIATGISDESNAICPVSALQPGCYFLTCISNNKICTVSFIKQ
ncbi:MAG: T9SS type A sorting domain-containing protein [Chitinophagales bacterium]